MIFAIKKFHKMLDGNKFTLIIEYKLMVNILDQKKLFLFILQIGYKDGPQCN